MDVVSVGYDVKQRTPNGVNQWAIWIHTMTQANIWLHTMMNENILYLNALLKRAYKYKRLSKERAKWVNEQTNNNKNTRE